MIETEKQPRHANTNDNLVVEVNINDIEHLRDFDEEIAASLGYETETSGMPHKKKRLIRLFKHDTSHKGKKRLS
jgi:hypothetical protein